MGQYAPILETIIENHGTYKMIRDYLKWVSLPMARWIPMVKSHCHHQNYSMLCATKNLGHVLLALVVSPSTWGCINDHLMMAWGCTMRILWIWAAEAKICGEDERVWSLKGWTSESVLTVTQWNFWEHVSNPPNYLVGGDWNHGILWLSIQLGMSWAQTTNSYFSEGYTTNQ